MSVRKLYRGDGQYAAERVEDSNRVRLYASTGEYLGEYVKSMDKTFDQGGNLIGFGDLLSMLIKQ